MSCTPSEVTLYTCTDVHSANQESYPGGLLPIMAYTGRLRPKGVPFSGLRYMKGGGTSLVEVFKRVGRSVICARERAQRADR